MLRIAATSLVLGPLFAGLLFAAAAHAQQNLSSEEEQARALFQAGATAYDAGRFEQALRYFQESYELSHRPALLFNIGSAADRMQDNQRALESYRAYLAAVPNAQNRELTQSRIEFLERAIARGGRVASPEEAARTVANGNERRSTTTGGGGGDITGEWWFWTIIGVLAVGAIVGIAVGVAVATSGPEQALPGDIDVFMALTER